VAGQRTADAGRADGPALPDAFFVPAGGRFVATEHARGPWSAAHQHGGPPSALMARAIEALVAEAGMRVVRVTVELLSPVPLVTLEVTTAVLRAGRKVQRVEATLAADGKPVCRAVALAIRVARLALGARPEPVPAAPPPPEACGPFALPFFSGPVGYHSAVETRLARGEWGRGPAAVWLRPRVTLVAGEPLTPLQRVMIAADSGNGVAISLDPARFTFLNPDLTVALDREPEGEWVCLDATTRTHPDGTGLTETLLWDARGPIGRGLQTLLVEPRSD
jgi:hypothetical protein